MKRYLLLLLLVLSFTKAGFAQQRIIFEENFDTNKNGWKLYNTSDFQVNIKEGMLHLEKTEKNFIRRGCLWYNKVIPEFNTLHNFSITLYARFISGGDIFEAIDLLWGSQQNNPKGLSGSSLYQLSLLYRGELHLNYFNQDWSYFINKDINSFLDNNFNSGQINKYDLIQQDGYVIFKINDQELFKQFNPQIAGNSIGFQQCMKSAWEIDKLIVRQDKPTTQKPISADSNTEIAQTKKYQEGMNAIKKDGLIIYPNPFSQDININFTLSEDVTVIVSLIDMKGTILQEHTKKFTKGAHTFTMYANISAGSYILKTQLGKESASSLVLIKQ